jgi:tetratricopeptide (TPR) repeat protein
MDVRRTKEWKRAECMYSELHATLAFPAFGRPSPQDIEESLEHMLRECPEFYPARIEVGLHRLVDGAAPSAEKDIEEGFRSMLRLAPRGRLEREVDILVDNLEKLWRFDLCMTILETLVSSHPRNASLRDSLGHAAARVGAVDEALVHAGRAVKADPTNNHYWSNLGWIHLIAGNLDAAAKALKRALDLDADDETAQGNQHVLRWLQARGAGTYLECRWHMARRN